jgi:hypothetical protein
MQRPTGVTILAVLAIIGGVLGLCGGLTLFGVGGLGVLGGSAAAGGMGFLFGGLSLVSAILYLAFGIGAWMLKPWAWILGIVGVAVSILSTLVTLVSGNGSLISAIISIIIPVIILWYLFRPEIKKAFGRA